MYSLIYESPIGKIEIVSEKDNIVKIKFITSKELKEVFDGKTINSKFKMENISNNTSKHALNKMENISNKPTENVLNKLGKNPNNITNTNTANHFTNINIVEQQVAQNCQKQLVEYFEGKRKNFNIKYKLSGTEFQGKVWEELTKIPYSKTISYKDIAVGIGKEKAVRAVANAVGKNNLGIVIPCHRVIGSNGKLTGFSAETDERTGLELKRELLNLEGNSEWK